MTSYFRAFLFVLAGFLLGGVFLYSSCAHAQGTVVWKLVVYDTPQSSARVLDQPYRSYEACQAAGDDLVLTKDPPWSFVCSAQLRVP